MVKNQNLHPAERLVLLRQTLGLSQRELAKEFQVSGGAIACWETGTRVIPGPVLKLIDLYEDSLPSVNKTRPQGKAENILNGLKESLSLKDNEEDLQEIQSLRNGVTKYFEDTASVNSLNGKLKRILIERLLKSLKNRKGVSAKVAQLASFLEMGLPFEVRNALGTLQSRAEPEKPKVIQRVVEEEYGKPLKEIFSYWQEKPLAVTSLGQVHYAKLANGKEVAVKVQHPNIKEILQNQISKMELAQSLASFLGKGDSDIFAEIKRALMQECDYRQEALNQEKFRNILSDDPRVIVPYIYRDLVRERVMVSEFIKAESFQNFTARANQNQKNAAAEILIEAILKASFGYCLVHTDLHPGNFLFTDGKVVLLDFGRVFDYPVERMKLEGQFYYSMLHRDYDKCQTLAKVLFAKEGEEFDFDAFWIFLQHAHAHLLVDNRFKFTRDYAKVLVREGRVFSKKHQLQMIKEAFWAFVFTSSTWGILADLEADINMRRISMKSVRLSEHL